MTAFKALEDVSKQFEEYLRKCSTDLVALKVGESFDDNVSNKLKYLALYTSKLRLLRANPISSTPEITQVRRDEETTLSSYGYTVMEKIIEQQVVKSVTQSHTVRKLLTSNEQLEPHYRERREQILSQLETYKQKERQLRLLDARLNEKQTEYNKVRERWDILLGELRDIRSNEKETEDGSEDPLGRKLRSLVKRMEMLRFLISKFITCRNTSYDWLSDPDKLISILKLTRQKNTVAMFTEK